MKVQQQLMSQGINFKPLSIFKDNMHNDSQDFNSYQSEQVSYMSEDKRAKRLKHEIMKMAKKNASNFYDRIQELKKKAS